MENLNTMLFKLNLNVMEILYVYKILMRIMKDFLLTLLIMQQSLISILLYYTKLILKRVEMYYNAKITI